MKKILYISYDGMTDQLGQSQVIPYLKALTKKGYRFTILSVEKKKKLENSGTQVRALLQEAGINWVTLIFTTRPPLLSKLFDQWKLNRKAVQLQKEKKFDLVHCRSYVAAAAGLKLSKRYGIPFLFDMRGFWVDERVDSGLWDLKNPLYRFFYKRYKKKEQNYFSGSAHIISLTQKGKAELINTYHLPSGKISVIPCCADLEHFDYRKISTEQKEEIKKKLDIKNGAKVLSYLGSLGGWYMTDEMLDFFAVLKGLDPHSVFLLITPDKKEAVISRAEEKGIPADAIRVQMATRQEVPLYIAVSDWNIFFIKDVYSKKGSSPTKQGEVMAMGVPLICNDIGDTGEIVQASGAGVLIKKFGKQEYEEVCRALDQLLKKDKTQIRQSAHQYYDLDNGVTLYSRVYEQLLN